VLRKTSIAAAVIAAATVGSALFGGVALANGNNGDSMGGKPASVTSTGGAGGAGGNVWQECQQESTAYNVIFDSNVEGDVTQTATASNTCTATGGAGGAGGDGARYY
jgi:hypothetical protein